MGLSSNTFWHQTRKDGLKGIINSQCLYYGYSLEDLTPAGYNVKFAYPMVSVCDLPLSETGNYLKKYGDYTLGFSSEWGKKHGFSTVWYYKNYRFYYERELRLVPDFKTLSEINESPILWDYEEYKKIHKGSSLLLDRIIMFQIYQYLRKRQKLT